MSDPEHFMARWSRRKREAAETAEVAKPVTAEEAESDRSLAGSAQERIDASSAGHESPAPSEAVPAGPAFDITQLPSLDSITAETDIRAFLAPGVPAELTRAALRRVWTADPTIRDFVGLAENAWDFTAPGGAPGFGPLEMTDELRKAVADMVGRSLAPVTPETAAPTASVEPTVPAVESSSDAQATPASLVAKVRPLAGQDETVFGNRGSCSRNEEKRAEQDIIAVQQGPLKAEDRPAIVSRSHGSALPK